MTLGNVNSTINMEKKAWHSTRMVYLEKRVNLCDFYQSCKAAVQCFLIYLLTFRTDGRNFSPCTCISHCGIVISCFHRPQTRWESRLDLASCLHSSIYCEFGTTHIQCSSSLYCSKSIEAIFVLASFANVL